MNLSDFDYAELNERYKTLHKGHQTELRRAASPDDIALLPGYYRLFPGIKNDQRCQRIAYFLPFIKHRSGAGSLGEKLANTVSEARLFQVIRSNSPNDLVQLRRLVQQVEPTVDWQMLGKTLFFWNDISKRNLLEEFFLHHKAPKKGS